MQNSKFEPRIAQHDFGKFNPSAGALDESALVKHYRRPLSLFFQSRFRDPSLAEDLAHDVLQIVIERIRADRIAEPDKLSAFVFGTARFVEAGYRRRMRRHGDIGAAVALDDQYEDAQLSPEQLLGQTQLRVLVQSLMAELPLERDRELLWDFYVRGIGKTELIAKHHLNAAQFDNALYRARNRLKEILRQWGWPQ